MGVVWAQMCVPYSSKASAGSMEFYQTYWSIIKSLLIKTTDSSLLVVLYVKREVSSEKCRYLHWLCLHFCLDWLKELEQIGFRFSANKIKYKYFLRTLLSGLEYYPWKSLAMELLELRFHYNIMEPWLFSNATTINKQ